nr:immunoglobulin heavy chain junction region [Macaca mulatta]
CARGCVGIYCDEEYLDFW